METLSSAPSSGDSLSKSPAQKFFIVDGHSYAYQAYYAIGGLQTPGGLAVGAAFGFTQLIERLLGEGPSHLAVVFDSPEVTFRSERFAEYKVHRAPMPEDLQAQIPMIKEVLGCYRIPAVEAPGYEADDVIATLAKRAARAGIDVYLVSKDKDLEQLIDERIRIFNPKDGECLDAAGLFEKKGLRPDQVVDFLALAGDSTDNVPGVEGIGAKTALKILAAVKRFEDAFTGDVPGLSPRVVERLKTGRESAELSRFLVTLDLNCPLPGGAEPEAFRVAEADRTALAALFERLRFRRLHEKYSKAGEKEPATRRDIATVEGRGPDASNPLPSRFQLVRTREDLSALADRLRNAAVVSFDTETTGLDPFRDAIVGLSFAVLEDEKRILDLQDASAAAREAAVEAFYVPLRSPEPLELSAGEVLDALRGPLEDPSIAKAGQNVKFDLLFYRNAGVRVRPARFDTMVASYLLNPEVRAHNLDALALEYLGYKKIPTEKLIGEGKDQVSMDRVPVQDVFNYACEDADVALRLFLVLREKLRSAGLESLMDDVEAPLVEVLADMEMAGIAVDPEHLADMAKRIRADLDRLTAEIHGLAGSEFNVASPAQLAEVLYGKLGLPSGPKGKSGVASTAADVLDGIEDRHPIVPKILEHRELTKLVGTYVEALPELIQPKTGRIHTSFNQTVAATGRLSSSNPNLQNIPIKTELGREIRKAFVAGGPDLLLLSADYSQVELRILAHFSNDPILVAAFEKGEDIHRSVAAQLYGARPEDVTPDLRRLAKAVNFGIIYGQTSFGLSRELGIPVEEAAAIIQGYFERHPGVRAFIDLTIARARDDGFVRTILGRRRPIRDLNSRNQRLRAIAERTAVNSVVQGSAADLIKVAMNNIHTDILQRESRARILLQIHDELVLEVPQAGLDVEEARVRAEMVEAMDLRVPLIVNTAAGRTWYESKE